MHDYLETVKAIDDVGEILNYLEAEGLAKNTLVIYTSDQGFYSGENGWYDKRFMHETSISTPLLMQYPNHIPAGTQITALTQNLDFAETFLDYAQIPIPQDYQGKSLKPLLEHTVKPEDFRNALYYHYYDFPAFHMVQKDRYKLIHFYDNIDVWEMYDLVIDLDERANIYNSPACSDIQKQLLTTLNNLQKQYGVTENEFTKANAKQAENPYNNRIKLTGNPKQ